MNTQKEKFGLFTTLSMITGIVIGSGIFFKTDDILVATGGSVALGVMLWVLAAIGIIFGGLSIAEYAKVESKAGGLITYCEMAWGNIWGYLAGWFQTILYFPAITSILCWVAAVYIGLLFGISDATDLRLWMIAFTLLSVFFLFNTFSTGKAGSFQNITLVIKIGSLLILASFGLFFGSSANLTQMASPVSTGGLFGGLVACAFAYDGWFVAPSVAHEIKNPKKNLARALILSPLIILSIYLAYFVGINAVLGPQQIMQLQDGSVGYIFKNMFGAVGTRLVYVVVIISILGTINGLVLGYIRLPYSLALRDEFMFSKHVKTVNKQYDVPLYSSLIAYLLSLVLMGFHALSVFEVNIGFLDFSYLEIDSIPIVLIYFFYISLYVYLIKTGKKRGVLGGLIYPSLAIVGSMFVIYGGFSQPQSNFYLLISMSVIALGIVVRPKRN